MNPREVGDFLTQAKNSSEENMQVAGFKRYPRLHVYICIFLAGMSKQSNENKEKNAAHVLFVRDEGQRYHQSVVQG